MSEVLNAAREEANPLFDAHCDAWEKLQGIPVPTVADIEEWLAVRKKFYEAQEKFEGIVRQIHG